MPTAAIEVDGIVIVYFNLSYSLTRKWVVVGGVGEFILYLVVSFLSLLFVYIFCKWSYFFPVKYLYVREDREKFTLFVGEREREIISFHDRIQKYI